MNRKKLKKIGAIGALIVLTLMLFRYDFSYNLNNHKVKHNETLWTIMSNEIFHNPAITHKSLKFIKSNNPLFDKNYIQANTSRFSDDGDIINVYKGKISIITAGGHYRLRPTEILHKEAVQNHNIQLIVQNGFFAFPVWHYLLSLS